MSFSVIHISDIHLKDNDNLIEERTDALKRACVSSLPANGDVVIAISGDVAFSGKAREYDRARILIDSLIEYIMCEKQSQVSIVCVPGNHDCDFDLDSNTRTTLINSVKSESIDLGYYNNVVGVQQSFNSFIETYGIDFSNVMPSVEIVSGKHKILFVLANTAWMSLLHENPGKIVMPTLLFDSFSPEKYDAVFYVLHHPTNWLNPDEKKQFVEHVRHNADIILVGHEHARDSYRMANDYFSAYYNHGKELQDSDSADSAFSVLNFDSSFQSFDVIDYKWDGTKYDRDGEITTIDYIKNKSSKNLLFQPNDDILDYAKDVGIVINHFSKEHVSLPDLFVWPEYNKCFFNEEKNTVKRIRNKVLEEINSNRISILVGPSCAGKTSVAKMLFLKEAPNESCCLLIDGRDFNSGSESSIRAVIEESFISQYDKAELESFRQLSKTKKTVIVDDFDIIKDIKNRRNTILDYLHYNFSRVIIIVSSSFELTKVITSDAIGNMDSFCYYCS